MEAANSKTLSKDHEMGPGQGLGLSLAQALSILLKRSLMRSALKPYRTGREMADFREVIVEAAIPSSCRDLKNVRQKSKVMALGC